MHNLPVLLADVDLIQIIIFLVIAFGSLASHLIKNRTKTKAQQPREIEIPPPQLRPEPGQEQREHAQSVLVEANPKPGGNALEKEIEAFLRQATGGVVPEPKSSPATSNVSPAAS